MAEAIALDALQWVASSITKKFIEKAVAYLGADLAKELEDLETTIFPQFQLVIKAAESSPHKQTVAKWLRRLKNAYYEVEDIFDELEYQHLENEVLQENGIHTHGIAMLHKNILTAFLEEGDSCPIFGFHWMHFGQSIDCGTMGQRLLFAIGAVNYNSQGQ